MEDIVVEVHDPGEPVASECFTGRWLVWPGREHTRPEEPGYQENWGVAQTAREQIAVYNAHPEGAWAELAVYPSLEAAARSGCVPMSILTLAMAEIGQEHSESSRVGRVGSRLTADGVSRLVI